jgi:hypothetical protein
MRDRQGPNAATGVESEPGTARNLVDDSPFRGGPWPASAVYSSRRLAREPTPAPGMVEALTRLSSTTATPWISLREMGGPTAPTTAVAYEGSLPRIVERLSSRAASTEADIQSDVRAPFLYGD